MLFRCADGRAIAAPGLLLSVLDHCRSVEGRELMLSLTPIPKTWDRGKVLSFLSRNDFTARIVERTLTLESQTAPEAGIAQVLLDLFTLDQVARSQPVLMQHARELAAEIRTDEVVHSLLDQRSGGRKLQSLLESTASSKESSEVEEAVIAALRKVGTQAVVHFNCGNGQLLRTITKSLSLKSAIGIEPSFKKAHRPVVGFELRHGSILEPPSDVSGDAVALIIDALPDENDLRSLRAAEKLFEAVGFDWVLCLEKRNGLEKWARIAADNFGYRVSPGWRIGEYRAMMCRRMPGSAARTSLRHSEASKIKTRLGPTVRIESEAKVLEAFSMLTVDPRWLIYLPPATATFQSERVDGPLESVSSILNYYRNETLKKVVVRRGARGSRIVAIVCRDEEVGLRRFGIQALGCLYTRKGRKLLESQHSLLMDLRDGLSRAGAWEQLKTDWICLEGEVLPWALKAEGLIREEQDLLDGGERMYEAATRLLTGRPGSERSVVGRECFRRYRAIVERYAEKNRAPISFSPFHLIASEGRTYFDQTRLWHLQVLEELSRKAGSPFRVAPYKVISLENPGSVKACESWCDAYSSFEISALPFYPKGRRGIAQPAFLYRGGEFLRLIHGPEYDVLENRIRLRDRRSSGRDNNRRLLKQLALAIEGVERFVAGAPLNEIEICVRGVLALD